MNRGNVVIADLKPYDPKAKVRPVLVVQNDRDNSRMTNTIVVMITGTVRRAAEATQHLIDTNHPDFSASGLDGPSVVNCSNLFTIHQNDVIKKIGVLSEATMLEVNKCLKAALNL